MIESLTSLNIRGACFFDEPLDRHTTFKVGGKVKMWIEPQDISDLKCALKEITANGLSWRVIGNGSNILAGENNLPDVVIKLSNFNKLDIDGYAIIAESGASLSRLVGFSIENSLCGLEFLAGIPGLVGGAIKGNAGANGKNIDSVLKEISLMDREGNVHIMPSEKINFGYRYSDIGDDVIILNAVFNLVPGGSEDIQELVRGYLNKRKEKFPSEPSAGCIFKNLPDMSAGRLIDSLGIKGFTIGDAMVSYKHANVIVNLGGAGAKDVSGLIKHIKDEVYKKAGINLELEIDCWGDVETG